jgi:hypothetical protein
MTAQGRELARLWAHALVSYLKDLQPAATSPATAAPAIMGATVAIGKR